MTVWPMWTSSVAAVPKMWTPSSLRVVGVDEQLQQAGAVAGDLAARDLAVARRRRRRTGTAPSVSSRSVWPTNQISGIV